MATSLSTCLLAPVIVLLPFALLLFTWRSRLSCVLSSQHFVWLFTSSLIIQCSNGLYLITHPNSTTIRLHNFRDSATLALRLVSPARWYALCRFFWSLGSALIPFCQSRQCPTPSVGHGFRPWWPCARCPTAAKVLYCSRGGLKGGARYVGPDVCAISWLSDTASGEACAWCHVAHVCARGRAFALCCKPAGGGALGLLGGSIDGLGLGLGLLGGLSIGGGLRLALGGGGTSHGLGYEFTHVN